VGPPSGVRPAGRRGAVLQHRGGGPPALHHPRSPGPQHHHPDRGGGAEPPPQAAGSPQRQGVRRAAQPRHRRGRDAEDPGRGGGVMLTPGDRRRIVVVTGMSGSGKSTAVRALEDAGYFCIDNLPVVLVPQLTGLAELATRDTRLALVIDAREGEMHRQAPSILARLRAEGHDVALIFFDASDESLVRRFSETRRRHPLAPEDSVPAGISREREALREVRSLPDEVIDTSGHTVHAPKALVTARFGPPPSPAPRPTGRS